MNNNGDTKGLFYSGNEALDFFIPAGKSYIYPKNKTNRQYQSCVTHTALFHNTLIHLPRGAGSSFVATVVILNFKRWYPRGKIFVLASNKSILTKQRKSCQEIGISNEKMAEMTANMKDNDAACDVIFSTYSNFACNRLKLPVDLIKCVIFRDVVINKEFNRVVDYLHGLCFRMVAFLDLPKNISKDLLNKMRLERAEIRTETSPDILEHLNYLNPEFVVVCGENKGSKDVVNIKNDIFAAYAAYAKLLKSLNVVSGNVATINKAQALKEKKRFEQDMSRFSKDACFEILTNFDVCIYLLEAVELLNSSGIYDLYQFIQNVRSQKIEVALAENEEFKVFMRNLERMKEKNLVTKNNPKIDKLKCIIGEYFSNVSIKISDTRIVIFVDACLVEDVCQAVKSLHFIKATSVADKKLKKIQNTTILEFNSGRFNTIITSDISIMQNGIKGEKIGLVVSLSAEKSAISAVEKVPTIGKNVRFIFLLTDSERAKYGSSSDKQAAGFHYEFCPSAEIPRMIPNDITPEVQYVYLLPEKSPSSSLRNAKNRRNNNIVNNNNGDKMTKNKNKEWSTPSIATFFGTAVQKPPPFTIAGHEEKSGISELGWGNASSKGETNDFNFDNEVSAFEGNAHFGVSEDAPLMLDRNLNRGIFINNYEERREMSAEIGHGILNRLEAAVHKTREFPQGKNDDIEVILYKNWETGARFKIEGTHGGGGVYRLEFASFREADVSAKNGVEEEEFHFEWDDFFEDCEEENVEVPNIHYQVTDQDGIAGVCASSEENFTEQKISIICDSESKLAQELCNGKEDTSPFHYSVSDLFEDEEENVVSTSAPPPSENTVEQNSECVQVQACDSDATYFSGEEQQMDHIICGIDDDDNTNSDDSLFYAKPLYSSPAGTALKSERPIKKARSFIDWEARDDDDETSTEMNRTSRTSTSSKYDSSFICDATPINNNYSQFIGMVRTSSSEASSKFKTPDLSRRKVTLQFMNSMAMPEPDTYVEDSFCVKTTSEEVEDEDDDYLEIAEAILCRKKTKKCKSKEKKSKKRKRIQLELSSSDSS